MFLASASYCLLSAGCWIIELLAGRTITRHMAKLQAQSKARSQCHRIFERGALKSQVLENTSMENVSKNDAFRKDGKRKHEYTLVHTVPWQILNHSCPRHQTPINRCGEDYWSMFKRTGWWKQVLGQQDYLRMDVLREQITL